MAHATIPNMNGEPDRWPKRVLVVRLGSMGDVVHALPAVATLRNALPEAAIGWIIEERWAELLCTRICPRSGPVSEEKPLVDNVHVVNTKAWRTAPFSDETWREALSARSELRRADYDVALDFQGAVKSAALAQWAGVPVRYGFAQPRERAAALFHSRSILARGTHVIEQNISMVQALIPAAEPVMQFALPRDADAEQWCDEELGRRGLREFAIINPGAGWGAKCWPAPWYGQIARELAREGIASIVNFGPGEERLAADVERASHGAAQAVPCSLGELIALLRRARLFLGGDTGPLHLAAALDVPFVALFGPTDPARTGPLARRGVALRSTLSRTTFAHHQQPDLGLLSITPEQVLTACRRLLAAAPVEAPRAEDVVG